LRIGAAVALGLLVVAAAAAAQTPDALDAVRRQCIAAASDAQQREQAIAALENRIVLIGRDLAGRQRDLADSRVEQQHLLGILVFLARNLPEGSGAGAATPLAGRQSEDVLHATAPALRTEAQALAGEAERVAALRTEDAAKERELAGLRATLPQDRQRLALLVARRQAQLAPLPPADAAAAARLARDAKDVAGLIKAADTAADRRDKGGADPTRLAGLRPFAPPQTRLAMPLAGTIAPRFGAADAAGSPSPGIAVAGGSAAEVTAPFDGQIAYAGPFGKFGLVLIIRHGRLYDSLLAGLGRVDVNVGQWVLTGEPMGAMPYAVDGSGTLLYVELRREGQPVDPQPWLAMRDDQRDAQDGDRRVNR
jgi:septal ring factor EnvC (AmiA/AmiB activator)